MSMVTINNKHYNLSAIVRIYDREVFFADGKSEVMTEPELQELLGWLFNERTPLEKMIDETRADLDLQVKKAGKDMSDNIDKQVVKSVKKAKK